MSKLMVVVSITIDIGSLSSIGEHDSVCFDINIADRKGFWKSYGRTLSSVIIMYN